MQNARRVAARRAPPPRGGSTFSDILSFALASLFSILVSLMGRRQVLWAKRTRQKLIELLGWNCSDCGTYVDIEIDCIEPVGHLHHAMGFTARMSFYRAQYAKGNLQLLCRGCHLRKTCQEGWRRGPADDYISGLE